MFPYILQFIWINNSALNRKEELEIVVKSSSHIISENVLSSPIDLDSVVDVENYGINGKSKRTKSKTKKANEQTKRKKDSPVKKPANITK